MKSLHAVIWLFLLTQVSEGIAQSIKDYYIPAPPNNHMKYYNMSPKGERVDMNGSVYYLNKGGNYDITKAQTMQGNVVSVVTLTVMFKASEVHMIESTPTTMMETNVKRTYSPSRVLLKMPPKGESVSWTYKDQNEESVYCKASWTTITVGGKEKEAIMLTKGFDGMKTKLIEYYVQGIGFFKSQMKGEDTQFTYEKYDGLSHDPTVK